jgi:hypothetical protein
VIVVDYVNIAKNLTNPSTKCLSQNMIYNASNNIGYSLILFCYE